MSIILIKKGVVQKLQPLGKVISSDIRNGFDKPTFFVQVMPIGDTTDCNINTSTVTINIHYFPKEKTDLELLKMIDKLKRVFVNVLDVEGRTFTLNDKRYDITDNVLQFRFDITYTEELEIDESEYEAVESINLNLQM